jgi:hypothetical protein
MPGHSPALKVAVPCPLSWDEMTGDDRVRFCGQCQQNVYNVASLTPSEVSRLIGQREGRLCLRLQQRPDGTVITRDCWYAIRQARLRLVGTALGLAAASAGFWGGLGLLQRLLARPRTAQGTCPAAPAPVRADPPPNVPQSAPRQTLFDMDGFQLPSEPPGKRRRRRRHRPEPSSYTITVGQYTAD